MSGPSLREAVEATDRACGETKPDFHDVNWSHPLEFLLALEAGDWVERIRMLRPNASTRDKIELCKIGHLEEGDPQELGTLMGELARRYQHIDIWGGCCGTWEKSFAQIANHVTQARVRQQRAAAPWCRRTRRGDRDARWCGHDRGGEALWGAPASALAHGSYFCGLITASNSLKPRRARSGGL